MTKDQWFCFIQSGGRISLTEWLALSEDDRDALSDAGADYRDDVIGNIGKATQSLLHALHLLKDKEAIDDVLTAQTFEEFRRARDAFRKD